MARGAVELDEVNGRRLVDGEAVGLRQLAQHGVNVREVVGGDLNEEGPVNFVIAQAAMQPAKEEDELHEDRCGNPQERK